MNRQRLFALLVLATVLMALVWSGRPIAADSGGPLDVGTDAELIDLTNAPGAVPYGEGWAVPLAGARPHWFTPSLEQEVRQAAGGGVAAPKDAPLPGTVGIRPGAWMIAPHGCTMNFVFARKGAFAIGTAGHCVDKVDQHVVILTLTPGTKNPVLLDIGKVIARHNNGIGDDFALVSIRAELNSWVSSTVAVIGGPCGQYFGSGPETVAHYGHGLAIGTGGTPRAGVAITWKTNSFGWDSPAFFGDSGSPVRVTDLKAAGNLTHLVVSSKWLPSLIVGTRIGKIMQIAKGWSLTDSPLCL